MICNRTVGSLISQRVNLLAYSCMLSISNPIVIILFNLNHLFVHSLNGFKHN